MSPRSVRLFWILPLFLCVLLAGGTAQAARITVGFDGMCTVGVTPCGPTVDPAANPADVRKVIDPSGTISIDLYLDLDPSTSPSEVASVFEADFVLTTSGQWGVTFDPVTGANSSVVNPGVSPFGVGTWPNAFGSLTQTLAQVSLTSDNAGGERLVARFNLMAPSDPGAFFQVALGVGTIVAKDVAGGLMDVPLGTEAGTVLAQVSVVPEPSTAFLLGLGLLVLRAAPFRSVAGERRR